MIVNLTLSVLLFLAPARAGDPGPAWQASYDAEARGDLRQSLASLEALPEADRDPYLFHLRRGWLRYGLGAHEDAVASYTAAVAAAPAALEPKLGLMLPLLALRRWTEAAAVADQVLAVDPRSTLARSRKAWCAYNLGRFAEAEAGYRAVLADYPSDVELRTGLGWSLQLQGRSAEAAAEFRRVLAVAPRATSAFQGLSETGK